MTDANHRVFGARAPQVSRTFSAARGGVFTWAVGLAALTLAGCASKTDGLRYNDACTVMKHEVEEKQKLDAQIKSLTKEVRTLRKQGDTASAVSAERRLNGLIESQRFLKDALDQSSRDCSPILKDAEPPLDPAVRERLRLEGK